MAKYVLDNNDAEIIRLSNDAFLYLTQEEEPLDEDNLIEARQLHIDFPLGFEIISHKYVDNGEVEVTIVPYIEAPQIKSKKQKSIVVPTASSNIEIPLFIKTLGQEIKNELNCSVFIYFDKIWWCVCIDDFDMYMDSSDFKNKASLWRNKALEQNINLTFSYCKPVKAKLTKIAHKGLTVIN